MTNTVRNKASEIITWLGGVCWVPSAVRRKLSTTTMRTNDVTMTRIEGASDRTVTRATSWTTRAVASPPVGPRSNDSVCAAAGPAVHARTAIRPAVAAVAARQRQIAFASGSRGG